MFGKVLNILPFLLLSYFCFAETNLDSLQVVFENEKNDSIRLEVLQRLGTVYIESDLEKLKENAEKYLAICDSANMPEKQHIALNMMGIYYNMKEQKEKAILNYEKALASAYKHGASNSTAYIYNNLGNLYKEMREYERATDYHEKAFEISLTDGTFYDQSFFLFNIAHDYLERGKYKKGLEKLGESSDLLQKSKSSNNAFAWGHNKYLYALAHFRQKDYITAKKYILEAIRICQKNKMEHHLMSSYILAGRIYAATKQGDTALSYYNEALKIANDTGLSVKKDEIDLYLSKLYLKRNQLDKAIEKSELGIKWARESESIELEDKILRVLVKAYEKKGNKEKTHEVYERLLEVSDSLAANERQVSINNMRYKHRLAIADADEKLLQSQKNTSDEKLKIRQYLTILVVFLIILVALFSLFQYKVFRKKQRENKLLEIKVKERTEELNNVHEKLTQLNKELEQFAHVFSSDLKNPLKVISKEVQALEQDKDNLNTDFESYLGFIKGGVVRLKQLIDDLFSFAQMERNTDLPVESCNLNELIEEAKASIYILNQEKNALVQHISLPTIFTNKAQLQVILKNLIENGIKYNTNEKPLVKITYKEKAGKHRIAIQDNGIGIDPKYHRDIFHMFKRLHSRKEFSGTGLGLTICQEIAHNLGGEIELESQLSKGATFIIVLPVIESLETGNKMKSV